jgi:hypothetical protein
LSITCVFLVRVGLDHDAPIHLRSMLVLVPFGVVGVDLKDISCVFFQCLFELTAWPMSADTRKEFASRVWNDNLE